MERPLRPWRRAKDDFTEDRIIKGMVGRELTNRYPERRCEIGDTIFEIKDWNVYHSDDAQRQVIKDVSLHVRKGEVVGLAGLMGAGQDRAGHEHIRQVLRTENQRHH